MLFLSEQFSSFHISCREVAFTVAFTLLGVPVGPERIKDSSVATMHCCAFMADFEPPLKDPGHSTYTIQGLN